MEFFSIGFTYLPLFSDGTASPGDLEIEIAQIAAVAVELRESQ